MSRAQKALNDMLAWSGTDEPDLYPYVRDVFTDMLGYPKDHVRVSTKGEQGKIPDIVATSVEAKPKDEIYWLVGEVKKERGAFRSAQYRREVWEDQLKGYVSADTVYALLIDPVTLTILRPDGSEVKTVQLDSHSAVELVSPTTECSLTALQYSNSVCETSLTSFKEGLSPSRYLDVTDEKNRKKFYDALRTSARELIDYSLTKLRQYRQQYEQYQTDLSALEEKVGTIKDERADFARRALAEKYKEAVDLFERDFQTFETRIGREIPKKEDEARRFLESLFATEGGSLVLARILFVRFLEDHNMTSRRISNGGIKAFRDYAHHVKDEYQFLLTDAYREAERIYRRIFEPSIFDWSHKGDDQLPRLLLRVFYRLNAFDFAKITGDILGNLYERFLDIKARKKLGEYYTPMYIAKYVIERIGFYDDPALLLDPACGSGTFLIAAAEGLIERLIRKGVKLDVAVRQAVELIHGLDLNIFAAFITQLQIIWHLLPYLRRANTNELPELKIYGGINSLVHSGNSLLAFSGVSTEAPIKVRDSKYRYVVGNPPYIRNERLKDKGPWRANYDAVDFHNSDIAYYFVTRAIEGKRDNIGIVMPPWLEEGGRMCFVLPMGLCDSRAASRVRDIILQYDLFEVTDLEDIAIHIFPSPQASGRATVAPVLVFIEKKTRDDSSFVSLVQIAENAASLQRIDRSSTTTAQISKGTFRQSGINPYGQILPKLRSEDIPVLRVLFSHPQLGEYATESTPTYGIGKPLSGALKDEPSEGLLPLGKGLNVFTFRTNPNVSSWVDLKHVRSPSIWGQPLPDHAYAVSTICLSLQCAMFDPRKLGLNASTLIFVPKSEYSDFPWDLLLNSSPVRFVHLEALRTALVGVGTSIGSGRRAAWCTVYPRTLQALPIPKKLLEESQALAEKRDLLQQLADSIARRWDTVAECIAESRLKPLALHGIDFSHWQSDIDEEVNFRLSKNKEGIWELTPYVEEEQPTLLHVRGSYELLNVVRHLLEQQKLESLTAREFQNLMVPEDPAELSDLLDEARYPDSSDIREFKKCFKEADDIIAKAFGLDDVRWTYIQNRLASPPFDVLEPRWPWKAVEMREIQEYVVDRFT